MGLQESKTYVVEVVLLTEQGELPTDREVEELIADQMSGELDDYTGLFCGAVVLTDTKE